MRNAPQDNELAMVCEIATMERNGVAPRPRAFAKILSGIPMYIIARLQDGRLRIDQMDELPGRLAPAVLHLDSVRELWLDRLVLFDDVRRGNIVAAIESIERFTERLYRPATICRGTRYLTIRIAQAITHAANRTAHHHSAIDGTGVEAYYEEAWEMIMRLLRDARCGADLPRRKVA